MSPARRFVLVGAGRIGATWIEALAETEAGSLAAIVDSSAAAREASRREYGCALYPSTAALPWGELDAAILATPPATHRELAIECLHGGLDVLCEKPLAVSLLDAVAMARAAEASGRVLTMASKFRFVGDVELARQMVREGELGEIEWVENAFRGEVDMRERWNARPELSGGGVLIDNGTHSLDLLRNLGGPLARLRALEGPRAQNLAVEEEVALEVEFLSGARGRIDLSWNGGTEQAHYASIRGQYGEIELGWQGSRVRARGAAAADGIEGPWRSFGSGYDKLGAFVAQLEDFCLAAQRHADPRITLTESMLSVLAVEAGYRSLESGGSWQSVGVLDSVATAPATAAVSDDPRRGLRPLA